MHKYFICLSPIRHSSYRRSILVSHSEERQQESFDCAFTNLAQSSVDIRYDEIIYRMIAGRAPSSVPSLLLPPVVRCHKLMPLPIIAQCVR